MHGCWQSPILKFSKIRVSTSFKAYTSQNRDLWVEFFAMRSSWIASPSIDLIVGCGAWSLPLLIVPYVFWGIGQSRVLGFYTLALFVNYPHYMATIYRAYRTREDFARYRAVTLYCTLFLIAVLIAAHGFYGLVPWLITIYLTWSPWH